MPTEWQNHLTEIREKNPHKNLKECMQIASQSYRSPKGNNKFKEHSRAGKEATTTKKKKKEADSVQLRCKNAINVLQQINKNLLQVVGEMSNEDLKVLQSVEKKMTAFHDKFAESSEEEETEVEDDDSDISN